MIKKYGERSEKDMPMFGMIIGHKKELSSSTFMFLMTMIKWNQSISYFLKKGETMNYLLVILTRKFVIIFINLWVTVTFLRVDIKLNGSLVALENIKLIQLGNCANREIIPLITYPTLWKKEYKLSFLT